MTFLAHAYCPGPLAAKTSSEMSMSTSLSNPVLMPFPRLGMWTSITAPAIITARICVAQVCQSPMITRMPAPTSRRPIIGILNPGNPKELKKLVMPLGFISFGNP